jgi:beta-lactamase class A
VVATPSPTAAVATTPSNSPQPPSPAITLEPDGAAFAPDTELLLLLQDALGESTASYGVYVKRLSDGRGASVNPDQPFRAASLFKLYVMWEAFRRESEGGIHFDDTMQVTQYHKTFELGTNAVQAGDVVTVAQALRLMISVSDTPTGVLLQDTLGFETVNTALEDLGIHNSGLFYPGNSLATARDLGVLLEVIARGDTLPAAAHEAMVELLLSAQSDYGLKGGVAEGIAVAQKTAALDEALHSAGIVYAPSGAYVIVVLWDPRDGDNLVEAISRRVYEYFEALPR